MGLSNGARAPVMAWSPGFSQGLHRLCASVTLSLFLAPGFLGKDDLALTVVLVPSLQWMNRALSFQPEN